MATFAFSAIVFKTLISSFLLSSVSFGIAILNNCPSTSGFKFKSEVLIA